MYASVPVDKSQYLRRSITIGIFLCRCLFKDISCLIIQSSYIWTFHFYQLRGTGPLRQDQFAWFSSAAFIVECDGSCMERKTTSRAN